MCIYFLFCINQMGYHCHQQTTINKHSHNPSSLYDTKPKFYSFICIKIFLHDLRINECLWCRSQYGLPSWSFDPTKNFFPRPRIVKRSEEQLQDEFPDSVKWVWIIKGYAKKSLFMRTIRYSNLKIKERVLSNYDTDFIFQEITTRLLKLLR